MDLLLMPNTFLLARSTYKFDAVLGGSEEVLADLGESFGPLLLNQHPADRSRSSISTLIGVRQALRFMPDNVKL